MTWLQLSHDLTQSISVVGLYGTAGKYDELNQSLLYSDSLDEIDYYFSLTHLEFFADKQQDNEIAFGAAYSLVEPIIIALDSVYSTYSQGTFVELSFSYLTTMNSNMTFTKYIKAGLDFGYASDTKKGYNHSALGGVLTSSHSSKLSCNLLLEHVILGTHVKQQTMTKQQNWLGIHAVYVF